MTIALDGRALEAVEVLLDRAEERRVAVYPVEGGGRYVDCGIESRGGLLAGIELARICLGALAEVSIVPGEAGGGGGPPGPGATDPPVQAVPATPYPRRGRQAGAV